MASLFTLPKFQAFDSSGDPLPGARLYFFANLSSTAQATYADVYLNTAPTNPVIGDAYGVFPAIWLDDLTYRVVLKTSGDVTLWTVDDIGGLSLTAAQVGAVLYPRSAFEIAASVTPTAYQYPCGDLRRYGAVGGKRSPATGSLTQGFENVQAANVLPCHWTSTSASADVDATHIYAACGYLFDGALESLITKTEAHHVRPVR